MTNSYSEKRDFVFARAGYRCEACGESVMRFGAPQLAHRIPQTKQNVTKYGLEIIHHPLNLVATCCLRCNGKVDIRNHPIIVAALVSKIKAAIREGKGK